MYNIILYSLPLLQMAAALPQLSYVGKGACTSPGQFICVSAATFALCDASMTGIIQSLAAGDARCAGAASGGVNPPAGGAPAPPPSTHTVYTTTTLATPPPPPPATTPVSTSTTIVFPSSVTQDQVIPVTSAPGGFATGNQVIPVTLQASATGDPHGTVHGGA